MHVSMANDMDNVLCCDLLLCAGRLGLGDQRNRDMPCEIVALRGKCVLQVSAGAWHSAALVLIPPFVRGGWVRILQVVECASA